MSEYRVRWIPNWIPWRRAVTIWWPLFKLPRVYIPSSRRHDELRVERTRAHEVIHVDQWVRLGRWRFLRTYFRPEGRLQIEAEAFAASCEWWYDRGQGYIGAEPVLTYYVRQLADHYGLDITTDACRAAIEGYLK
jgi:hypothetical protein